MVQNVITSAFETVQRVDEGVEILDIFQHFSVREVGSSVHPAKGIFVIISE